MPENMMLRPLDFPPMSVQTQATAEQLARMIARVEAAFSDVQYESLFRNQNDEDFARAGREQANLIKTTFARSDISFDGLETCLELGCGYGRATHVLATLFPKMLAVDISVPHLHAAKAFADKKGIQNITFMHMNKIDSLKRLPNIDVFYSRFVLQHNPPPIIHHILDLVLSKLRPGGLGYFQVAVYALGYRFNSEEYLASRSDHQVPEMHMLPQPELFQLLACQNCRLLDIREDSSAGEAAVSFHLLTQKM